MQNQDLIDSANAFAAAVLELAAALYPTEPRTPEALAVITAGCELARWRLLEPDPMGNDDPTEHARALAVDLFEEAAAIEIGAVDPDDLAALVAEWEAEDAASEPTNNHAFDPHS